MIRMTFIPDARFRGRAHPPSRTVPATPAPATFRKSLRVRVLFTPPSPKCTPEAIIVIDECPGYAGQRSRRSNFSLLPATALPCENAHDGRTIGGDGYGQAAEVCVGSLEDAVGTFHPWVAEAGEDGL
jgi:hypothetical protein